jgi:tetratricopeptide (TPR) repeat protein
MTATNLFSLKSLIVLLLLSPLVSFAQLTKQQQAQIDSLKQVIETAKHDSTVIKAWKAWDDIIYVSDPELDLELNIKVEALCAKNLDKPVTKKEKTFFLKAQSSALNNSGIIYMSRGDQEIARSNFMRSLKIREALDYKRGITSCLTNIGITYVKESKYEQAMEYFTPSLVIAEKIGDQMEIAGLHGNISQVYKRQGNVPKAIVHLNQCLKIYEELNHQQAIATSLNNLGNTYRSQNDDVKALDYYTRSLKIREEIGDQNGIATSLLSIGNMYSGANDDNKALELYNRSLVIAEKMGDQETISLILGNIGNIHLDQGNLEKAQEHYIRALAVAEEIGAKSRISGLLNSIAILHRKQGNYTKAMAFAQKAIALSQEIGDVAEIKNSSKTLYLNYKATGNYKASLAMHELYIEMRDSTLNQAAQKELIRQEYKYTYEKQTAADSIKNAEAKKVQNALLTTERAKKKQLELESKRQRLENKNQQQQAYFLYGGLALALLFGAFIFNRFKVTQKQKGIIESQKTKVDEAYDQLEEKNTEILDSITYAKRIQSAILPPQNVVKEYLKNSFILYKPKDIVAGDFYWLEAVDGTTIFAAADCTGHGVPGAMVSVVCHNAMNRAVREFGLTEPGKILDKVNELVEETFVKSDHEVKDGMDLALCALKGNTLQYAGAHNPLWIVRKEEILETKADKQPIGSFNEHQPYTTHTFELDADDTFYLFSDGLVDQFGGEKGKKFKPRAFRELLLSIQNKPMHEQRSIIDDTFENWRGDLEQVDDVCVIGVQV